MVYEKVPLPVQLRAIAGDWEGHAILLLVACCYQAETEHWVPSIGLWLICSATGSTLIGCERQGRKARLMELDARYADVIVRRFQEYVGQKAVLEGDGRSFEEIARLRLEAAP